MSETIPQLALSSASSSTEQSRSTLLPAEAGRAEPIASPKNHPQRPSENNGFAGPSDEVLFAAYIKGDERAFIELHRRHRTQVTALLRRNCTTDDVADLVQQTFLQLHRARRDYREGEPLRPWLNTIALNLARDAARRSRTRRRYSAIKHSASHGSASEHSDRHEAQHPFPSPEQVLEASQSQARVRQAVEALNPKDREVVVLHWYQGLPFAEVAARMSVSLSAAKVRAHRAYARLRSDLNGDGHGHDVHEQEKKR